MNEKRYFKRVNFPAEVQVVCNENILHGDLLDISLKGALINIPEPGILQVGHQATIRIYLSSTAISITAEADVVHRRGGDFGFRFFKIDAESIGHLRRLLELNLGNSKEVNSELEYILNQQQKG
ncbi:MAG: hypothetical protein GWP07_02385 [Xanthomonadaceae bacterium]|nr:hypothetical protein [Xanthomonadaceae bacterium]